MDCIVRRLWCIASSAVAADDFDASCLEGLRVGLRQVVEGGLGKFLNVLDADDQRLGLASFCAFVEGGAEDSCAATNIKDLRSWPEDI